MPHLIKPIQASRDKPIPLPMVISQIQLAHDYLVRYGVLALQDARATEESPQWGSNMKRIQVAFPVDDRPELIGEKIESHNLTEVYNQCATIERLLDALHWAKKSLPDYQVVKCHPTTSSDKTNLDANIPDNDLVLVNADGEFACFEVSDVTSAEQDSNGKKKKDLRSLGVIALTPSGIPETWPKRRLFLVVSKAFATQLKDPKSPSQKRHYRYDKHETGDTCVVEVLPVAMAD